jgi:hypothetical protein
MTETLGTKETREVIDFVFGVTRLIAREQLKAGLSWMEAVRVLTHADFQRLLATAASGISEIDDELKDLSGAEGLDLAVYALGKTRELFSELRGVA